MLLPDAPRPTRGLPEVCEGVASFVEVECLKRKEVPEIMRANNLEGCWNTGSSACSPEADLRRALLSKLKELLIELSRAFCFVGSEFPLQVRAAGTLPLISCSFIAASLDGENRKAHERPWDRSLALRQQGRRGR